MWHVINVHTTAEFQLLFPAVVLEMHSLKNHFLIYKLITAFSNLSCPTGD